MTSARRPLTLCLSLSALLCADARAGFWVGHPVPELAPAGESLTWIHATLPTADLELEPCGAGSTQVVVIDADIDLLDADAITLPLGDWCEATLIPDGELVIEATRAGGGDVDITVDVSDIPLALPGSLSVDPNVTGSVIALFGAGWFADLANGSATTVDIIVGTSDPEHDDLVDALRGESTLTP